MATQKKPAAKPAKKTTASNKGAKKAAPAKKSVASKNTKATPKKPVKKAATAAKKAVPNKTTKTAKKVAATKKVDSKKTKELKKTVTSKKSAPAKKAPVKKAAPAAKAAPAKKAPVKAAPAKKVEVKKAAPAPVAKKAAPAPAPKAVPVKKEAPVKSGKKSSSKPHITKTVTTFAKGALPARPQSASAHTAAAPTKQATPVRGAEKKPGIIVAHRRLENKSKNKADDSRTMINYQPEFTRSILDEHEQVQGPVYRYSDEELTEFRELIMARLDKARKELTYQQGLITRKDEAGTEDTENRYMNMEDGSGAMEREQLAQLASRQIQFINHLEKALMRIENKTYGICRVTGKLIDKARLRAVPHATLSIEAKLMGSK
jgi:RNA polymerase-binding transcription factor DksA